MQRTTKKGFSYPHPDPKVVQDRKLVNSPEGI